MDFRLPMLVDLEGVEMKNFKGEMKEDSGNRKGGEEGVRCLIRGISGIWICWFISMSDY